MPINLYVCAFNFRKSILFCFDFYAYWKNLLLVIFSSTFLLCKFHELNINFLAWAFPLFSCFPDLTDFPAYWLYWICILVWVFLISMKRIFKLLFELEFIFQFHLCHISMNTITATFCLISWVHYYNFPEFSISFMKISSAISFCTCVSFSSFHIRSFTSS